MNQMGAEDNVDLFTLDIESFGMENQQIVLFHYDEKKILVFFFFSDYVFAVILKNHPMLVLNKYTYIEYTVE